MKLSEEFKEKKRLEIENLRKVNHFLKFILKNNESARLISDDVQLKIEEIIRKNSELLYKLETDEFEIAVVGLEKAGKSTLINALIKNNILPSDTKRCTFTSTKLVYCSEDRAVVEFYNSEEFDKIFKNLLKDIEYPNWEGITYKNLTIDEFNRYFQSLESEKPEIYKMHIGRTDEEIRDILEVRDEITLDRKPLEFYDKEIFSSRFQAYIRGENGNTAKPRSAKKVEINSSELRELDKATIYDVPGFDSPTKIHERQTLERLRKADVIILVTNLGRTPNLKATELNIITKNSDDDGIPLRKKLFVFGNQIDKVNSEDDINKNINILLQDIRKFKIAELNRVYVGSAYKYLIDNNLIENGQFNLSFEIPNQVENLYKGLVKYYENNRFENLKRKIEINRQNIKDIFEEIEANNRVQISDEDFIKQQESKIILETSRDIAKLLVKNLRDLRVELKKEIFEEKYFSNKIKNKIESSNFLDDINQKDIERIKRRKDSSVSSETPIEKINHQIREELHQKILRDYTDFIIFITDNKLRETEERLFNSFIDAVIEHSNAGALDRVIRETKEFISRVNENKTLNESTSFVYLSERFSRDIFDIILYPIGSSDRKDKFEKAYNEFKHLDSFYNKSEGSLISLLLRGYEKDIDEKGLLSFKNKSEIVYQEINQIIDFYEDIGELPYDTEKNKVIKDKARRLRELLIDIFPHTDHSSNNDDYNENNNKTEIEFEKIGRSTTEEELKNEINIDISNIKDILKNAVIPATNLELMFFNSIDKRIQELLMVINGRENQNYDTKITFEDYISSIVYKIKRDEMENIKDNLVKIQIKKRMLRLIRRFRGNDSTQED